MMTKSRPSTLGTNFTQRPPMMTAKSATVVEQLVQWSQTFEYRPTGSFSTHATSLSQRDAETLCRHQLVPIWQYLVTRVTTQKRRRGIRDILRQTAENPDIVNACPKLAAYRVGTSNVDERKRKLLSRRSALQKELYDAKAQIEQVSMSCGQLSSDVSHRARKSSTAKRKLVQQRQKMQVYQAYGKEVGFYIHIIKRSTEMLRRFIADIKNGDRRVHMSSLHVKTEEACTRVGAIVEELLVSARNSQTERFSFLEENLLTAEPVLVVRGLLSHLHSALVKLKESNDRGTFNRCGQQLSAGHWQSRFDAYLQRFAGQHVCRYTEGKKLLREAQVLENNIIQLMEGTAPPRETSQRLLSNLVTERCDAFALRNLLEEIRLQRSITRQLLESQFSAWADIHCTHASILSTVNEMARGLRALDAVGKGSRKAHEESLSWIAEHARNDRAPNKIGVLKHQVDVLSHNLLGFCYAEFKALLPVNVCKPFQARSLRTSSRLKRRAISTLRTPDRCELLELQTAINMRPYNGPENVVHNISRLQDAALAWDISLNLYRNIEETSEKRLSLLRRHLQSQLLDYSDDQDIVQVVSRLAAYIEALNAMYSNENTPRVKAKVLHAHECVELYEELKLLMENRSQLFLETSHKCTDY
ncbi:hypothetical protein, variant [Spizellomyces punctatus DAOM BR117]|uniref:Uncharacterized protein n=1 Tax=Spizellomyces punctatus (strain DAOM BR117) TaxID=645134 RepID=A0A0L0HMG2_SPIPD|nr:hypothetical protein, variant [Spizellomyces punctatus DAOM BR117]KND02297.1 hypothetical protein, variant [Spizellomyces punctatus DAOM BR117]|eukprot:XP_016610336.1 hypothetical protein, variant [Spizellomyces punctatus DAOM BR117]